MDRIRPDDLTMFAARAGDTHVSMFAPMVRCGPQTAQNPIRWKNLLARTETMLRDSGAGTADVAALLDPARKLMHERLFWEYQSDGLAFFARPAWSRQFRLPLDLPELAVVGDRFIVAPLLDMLGAGGRFLLLALSRQQARLFEGTRFGLDEVPAELPAGPTGDRETRDRPGAFVTGRGASGAGVVFYARGDVDQRRHEEILQYFRAVDAVVRQHADGDRTPLLLCGVGALLPLYREVSSYPHLLSDGLPTSAEQLSLDALHAQAWAVLEPLLRRDVDAAAARYRQLIGTGYTVTEPSAVLAAAEAGRVDTLFLAASALRPPNAQHVLRLDARAPSVPDQLDQAAAACLAHGGTVHAVPDDRVPGNVPAAAVLRF